MWERSDRTAGQDLGCFLGTAEDGVDGVVCLKEVKEDWEAEGTVGASDEGCWA